MSKELYIDLYLLIDERIKYHTERAEEFLNGLDLYEDGDGDLGYLVGKIKSHREKIKYYQNLLTRFESEVVEPNWEVKRHEKNIGNYIIDLNSIY